MDSPARAWREFPQRYRLEASKCTQCEKILYPPRLVCPKCGASMPGPGGTCRCAALRKSQGDLKLKLQQYALLAATFGGVYLITVVVIGYPTTYLAGRVVALLQAEPSEESESEEAEDPLADDRHGPGDVRPHLCGEEGELIPRQQIPRETKPHRQEQH